MNKLKWFPLIAFLLQIPVITQAASVGGGNIVYMFDGSGNPIASTAGALNVNANFTGTIGTVGQGASGVDPWQMDLEKILGAAPSATNYLPSRITNGTSYVDPTQIRALSSGTDSVACSVSNFPATQAVTQSGVWTFGLPTGASTAAKQDTGNTSLASILSQLQGTTAVSGTVTANVGTTGGLALDATLSSAQPRKMQDGAGNALTSQANGAQRAADVGINVAGVQVDPRNTRALTSADVVSAVQSGAWNVTNISGTVSLPTGASTAARQDTGNTSLSSIDGKLPALVSSRVPVDGSGVTQPVSGSVSVSNFPATQPVSGTVAATQSGTWSTRAQDGSGNALTSQANGAQRAADVGINVAGVQVDPRSIRALTSADVVSSAQSGTWNVNNVTGSVSLPTGASTSANQTTANTSLSSIDGKLGTLGQKAMTGSAPVVIASDQSAIPASQSGTWNITNISGTVSLPTGAATAANQSTASSTLSTIATHTNGYSFRRQNSAATVTLKSAAGVLRSVCMMGPINGSTIEFWDNTAASGTVIGLITPPNGSAINCFKIDAAFSTGLTFTTVSTADWTITYE